MEGVWDELDELDDESESEEDEESLSLSDSDSLSLSDSEDEDDEDDEADSLGGRSALLGDVVRLRFEGDGSGTRASGSLPLVRLLRELRALEAEAVGITVVLGAEFMLVLERGLRRTLGV